MPIYLDHAATTPLTPAALAAYVGALGVVGNPSSIHGQGQQAKRMLEEARETVAASLGAEPVEVVFTSGGTESVNLGLKGLFWARQGGAGKSASGTSRAAGAAPDARGVGAALRRPRVLVPGGEHHATNDAVEWLVTHEGAVVEWLPVDEFGRLTPEALEAALAQVALPQVALAQAALPQTALPHPSLPQAALPHPSLPQAALPHPSLPHPSLSRASARATETTQDVPSSPENGSSRPLDPGDRVGAADDVALVSFLWANNEVGTLQPVAELAAVAARYGIPVHVDAVSAYGYVSIDFHALGVAALSVSAHKIGGPVGVGALVLSRTADVVPLIHGGGQQRGRSGTQDVAGAVAFAAAAREAVAALPSFRTSIGMLRDRLVTGIQSTVPSAVLRGDPSPQGRLPGNAHFTFAGCEGDSLLFLLDAAGFSVSTGSACQAGVPEVSHVLTAMGVPESEARGALRMTLGHGTTTADVDALVAALPAAVARAAKAGFADRVVA